MKASTCRTALLAAAALCALAFAPAANAAPVAHAAKACKVNRDHRALGPTYTTKLSVSRTTCSGGINLIRKWDKCRRARGGYGKGCPRVLGFRCSEHRYDKSKFPVPNYYSNVKCSKGGKRVNFTVRIGKGKGH